MMKSKRFACVGLLALLASCALLYALSVPPALFHLQSPDAMALGAFGFAAAGWTQEQMQVVRDALTAKFGELSQEMKGKLERLQGDVLELQQQGDKFRHSGGVMELGGAGAAEIVASLGSHDAFQAMREGKAKFLRISVEQKSLRPPMEQKSTIVSSSTLVPATRVGMFGAPERPLRVRDVLSSSGTDAGTVEFCRYTVTNNAAIQYDSPNSRIDGGTKPESAMSFTLVSRGASTIAHWIPASVQVLSDAPGLQALIESELLAGLGDEEDDELLNGDGTSGHLDGLMVNATAYNRGLTADSMADTLRRSITQVRLSKGRASAIILHPGDAESLDLLKDGEQRYLQVMMGGRVWAVPVVETEAMTEGSWLTGDFTRVGHLHERQNATVDLSREHSDFFIKNLVAIRAEERLILAVYRPSMLVKGTF